MLGKINAHGGITGSDIIAYCKKVQRCVISDHCRRHETRGEISKTLKKKWPELCVVHLCCISIKYGKIDL